MCEWAGNIMALGSNTLPLSSKLPGGWKAGRLGGEGKDEGEKGWKAEKKEVEKLGR